MRNYFLTSLVATTIFISGCKTNESSNLSSHKSDNFQNTRIYQPTIEEQERQDAEVFKLLKRIGNNHSKSNYSSKQQNTHQLFIPSEDQNNMRKSLTTLLATAGLYTGSVFGQTSQPVTSRPTRTYVPAKIQVDEINQKSRSTDEYRIDDRSVELNGVKLQIYRNEFPEANELEFMFAVPNEATVIYGFQQDSNDTTGIVAPKQFYIPTRVEIKDANGKTVPARTITLNERVQEGIPFALTTFTYNGTEFFHPNAKDNEESKQSFYIIGMLPNQENVTRDLQTGVVTIIAENGDGIIQKGEGIFRPLAVSADNYLGRKIAFEKDEADRIAELQKCEKEKRDAADQLRLKQEKDAELQRQKELSAPKTGSEGSIGTN